MRINPKELYSDPAHARPPWARIKAFSAQRKQAQINSACASLLEGDYDSAEVSYRVALCLSPATEANLATIGRALRTMRNR
jgi:hypothetical protein